MHFLLLLSISCFIGSLSLRMLDPVVPQVARDLSTAPEAVALLSTAFMASYAITQPFLGAIADAYGKVRIIKLCSAALALMLVLMAFAPTIEVLYISRILGGMFGGGVFTVALAVVGDRVPLEGRQVALSNLIMASQSAQLFGVAATGFIASYFGWRSAVGAAAVVAIIAAIMLQRNLHPRPGVTRYPFNLARLASTFSQLVRNPRTRTCYSGVLLDGMSAAGIFPFIAILLEQQGEGSLREAGFVIAGFALGGILYTFTVRRLLALVGNMLRLLRLGGIICAAAMVGFAFGGPWPLQMAYFAVAGFGFFMVHASLQAQATDVAPDLRASSVSLHSTFYTLGMAIGPAIYAVGINTIGARSSVLIGAAIMLMIGLLTAASFERISAGETAKSKTVS